MIWTQTDIWVVHLSQNLKWDSWKNPTHVKWLKNLNHNKLLNTRRVLTNKELFDLFNNHLEYKYLDLKPYSIGLVKKEAILTSKGDSKGKVWRIHEFIMLYENALYLDEDDKVVDSYSKTIKISKI